MKEKDLETSMFLDHNGGFVDILVSKPEEEWPLTFGPGGPCGPE